MSLVPEPHTGGSLQGAPGRVPERLPLFPLQTVLFPGAVLGLKVFEARYLDLMSECMRTGRPFGVICLQRGSEVQVGRAAGDVKGAAKAAPLELEQVGVLAHVAELDAQAPGILHMRCQGRQRFRRLGPLHQRRDGLWLSAVEVLPEDAVRAPGAAVQPTVQALADAIEKLRALGRLPFSPPFHLDDAGWVANRWCELLPVPLAAKQKLLELQDPVIRLSIVDGYLRDKKIVLGT